MDIIPSDPKLGSEGILPHGGGAARGARKGEKALSFYVKVMTRGEKGTAQGSPSQAMDYLTDGHDQRRVPAVSEGEVEYIARMGEGWKTELEGGRIPMVGFGRLKGIEDQAVLRDVFEDSCKPSYQSAVKGGTTGYKSIVATLPKEASLYAEGHPEEAKAAMYAAAGAMLEKAFPGRDITAVAAIHTRNENGEIHYHIHILVGKFARDLENGKSYSLNSVRGGNTPERVSALKNAWKEEMVREFKDRLGVGMEQTRTHGPVVLELPDGTRIEPLNRASRRILEKELEPTYSVAIPTGECKLSVLKLNEMDSRIFEIASGKRGKSGWDREAFEKAFPDQAKWAGRHEKRVETLKQIGYLTNEGRITQDFKNHYAAKFGGNTPELQRLRIELAKEAAKQSGKEKRPVMVPNLWDAVQKSENLRRRIERLGYSEKDIRRVMAAAETRKPTPENLRRMRQEIEKTAQERASEKARAGILPTTKTISKAFVDLQKAKIQRTYLSLAASLRGDFTQRKMEADRLVKASEWQLRTAKERRIAQVDKAVRPVFRAVKILLPDTARRFERARKEMVRIAAFDETKAVQKETLDRLYSAWRAEYIDKPIEALKAKAQRMEAPAQKEQLPKLQAAQAKVQDSGLRRGLESFQRGAVALAAHRPEECRPLAAWQGREAELVSQVLGKASGEAVPLPDETRRAVIKAGKLGTVLEQEEKQAKAAHVPGDMEKEFGADLRRIGARMSALGIESPFTKEAFLESPRGEIRRGIEACRKEGLLDEGQGWAFHGGKIRELAQELGKGFERDKGEADHLIDRLIQRRQA
jgi:hypothetical protein